MTKIHVGKIDPAFLDDIHPTSGMPFHDSTGLCKRPDGPDQKRIDAFWEKLSSRSEQADYRPNLSRDRDVCLRLYVDYNQKVTVIDYEFPDAYCREIREDRLVLKVFRQRLEKLGVPHHSRSDAKVPPLDEAKAQNVLDAPFKSARVAEMGNRIATKIEKEGLSAHKAEETIIRENAVKQDAIAAATQAAAQAIQAAEAATAIFESLATWATEGDASVGALANLTAEASKAARAAAQAAKITPRAGLEARKIAKKSAERAEKEARKAGKAEKEKIETRNQHLSVLTGRVYHLSSKAQRVPQNKDNPILLEIESLKWATRLGRAFGADHDAEVEKGYKPDVSMVPSMTPEQRSMMKPIMLRLHYTRSHNPRSYKKEIEALQWAISVGSLFGHNTVANEGEDFTYKALFESVIPGGDPVPNEGPVLDDIGNRKVPEPQRVDDEIGNRK